MEIDPAATRLDIRLLTVAEAAASRDRLRAIFADAVRSAGPSRYTAAQVAAWAQGADDVDAWDARLRDSTTWIATQRGAPVAFATTRPADEVDLLFVAPSLQRRGVAQRLLVAIEAHARSIGTDALRAHASLFGEAAFARAGFAVVGREDVETRGQTFSRALMRKALR